ncbi:MAG: radical SAM protein [Planctomycetaceae bacterium]|nr:radical SAM protein [Planctomycetaceae bacterium]
MDSREKIHSLEINVALACNLKCEYCSHLGRFMKGILSWEEIELWYQSWNQKILPGCVRILGGEPLLHPDLERILRETKEYWPDSRMELVTNGLLLHKSSPELLSLIQDISCQVKVTKHFDDPGYNKLFDRGIAVLRQYAIEPAVEQSHLRWRKCYQIDPEDNAKPFQSDPQKAWENCFIKNFCTTLFDNKLYRCSILGCFAYARQKGFVLESWNVALEYQPLSHHCSREDIRAMMNQGACTQCSICPEKHEYATPYEKMNPFGLPILQTAFSGKSS